MTHDILLSSREKRLLRRLAAGKTDQEIASNLGGTLKQISEQRTRLLNKIGIRSETEIIEAAVRLAPWRRKT
jgi:DNA-binding CsgD family transcriptional regulator